MGWSRDDLSFFAMTNERDRRFFDVYRHDAGDYKRSVVYENKDGYLPSAGLGRRPLGRTRKNPRRPPTATSISGTPEPSDDSHHASYNARAVSNGGV